MVTSNVEERRLLLPLHAESSNAGANARSGQTTDLDFDARFANGRLPSLASFEVKAQRDTKPALLITQFDGLGQAQAFLDAKLAANEGGNAQYSTTMTHGNSRNRSSRSSCHHQGSIPK